MARQPIYVAQGIYRGKTAEELAELRTIAEDRLVNGDRISLSGAGKSSTRKFDLTPSQMLIEINYASDLLTTTRRPSRTFFDVGGMR